MKPERALLLIALVLCALPARAEAPRPGDGAGALMAAGKYGEAAREYEERLRKKSDDTVTRLYLGRCLLKKGDISGADENIDAAVTKNPLLTAEAARIWSEEGEIALNGDATERALAMFSKAVAYDPSLKAHLGASMLARAAAIGVPAMRARIVARIAPWVGTEEAVKASAEYYRERLGPPRVVVLDLPGWAELANVRSGDELHYLSAEPLMEKNSGAARIMPESAAVPLKLVFGPQDMGASGSTTVLLSRHKNPTKVYLWIIPGGQ